MFEDEAEDLIAKINDIHSSIAFVLIRDALEAAFVAGLDAAQQESDRGAPKQVIQSPAQKRVSQRG